MLGGEVLQKCRVCRPPSPSPAPAEAARPPGQRRARSPVAAIRPLLLHVERVARWPIHGYECKAVSGCLCMLRTSDAFLRGSGSSISPPVGSDRRSLNLVSLLGVTFPFNYVSIWNLKGSFGKVELGVVYKSWTSFINNCCYK